MGSLGQLALHLQISAGIRSCTHILTSSTATYRVFVCELRDWHPIVRSGVSVRAKEHGKSRMGATLPLASSFACHRTQCISAARGFQSQFLGEATTHDQRSFQTLTFRSRKHLFAYKRRLLAFHFASLYGHVASFGAPFVHVMLNATENELHVVHVPVVPVVCCRRLRFDRCRRICLCVHRFGG